MKKSVWILAMVTALMVTLAGMASAHLGVGRAGEAWTRNFADGIIKKRTVNVWRC